jgi:hypothetical protein
MSIGQGIKLLSAGNERLVPFLCLLHAPPLGLAPLGLAPLLLSLGILLRPAERLLLGGHVLIALALALGARVLDGLPPPLPLLHPLELHWKRHFARHRGGGRP